MDKKWLSLANQVADTLLSKEQEIVEADTAIGFTSKHSRTMVKQTAEMLRNMEGALKPLEGRKGICGKAEEVTFLLAYNMSSLGAYRIICELAVGNRVRIKPSEIAYRSGKIMASIWQNIAPESVSYDFRPGAEYMDWAIKEPSIKAIVLWGSHLVALSYMERFKASGKKFIFEGPGKNPFIILEDADLAKAAQALFLSRFRGAGQICVSPGVMYIHRKVFPDFLDEFTRITRTMVVGDPKDPATDIGPIGSPLAVSRIKDQLEDARKKGGKIVQGGKIEGNLVYPTIVLNANHQMAGMREESFGPICWFQAFDTTEEVIALAKDSKFGLEAAVYGHQELDKVVNALKGEEYLQEVNDFVFGKYGAVRVNPEITSSLNSLFRPFGGYAYSGWVCETVDGKFKLKQGPKIIARETSELLT